MEKESVKIGDNRREDGTFGPDNCANPDGRPKDTEEKKLVKKAIKQLVAEYKESLADALPQISLVLVEKALKGDNQSIKEINDIIVDKAPKNVDVTSGGDKIQPILVRFLDK